MKSQRPSFIFSHYSSFSGVHLLLRVTEVSGSEISPRCGARQLSKTFVHHQVSKQIRALLHYPATSDAL